MSATPTSCSSGSRPAADVLPGLAAQPWQHLRKAVRALGEDPPDEQLHEVRIRAKRARYAAEVAALVAGKRARRFAKAVAGVQEVLGQLQDASVSEAWLRDAVADVPPATAAVVLRLAAEDRAEAERVRAVWRTAWEPLADKGLRSWLKR